MVFMGGIVAGVWLFAEAYVALAGLMERGDLGAVTLADLLAVPFWVVAAGVVVVAAVTFAVIARFEGGRGGSR
jgi:hypothetical protein